MNEIEQARLALDIIGLLDEEQVEDTTAAKVVEAALEVLLRALKSKPAAANK